MFSMLRILAAVTTVGAVATPVVAEPSKTSPKLDEHILRGIAHPASLTVTLKPRHMLQGGKIASAVAPLDLRTLTLADFGDVDSTR